MKVADRMLPVGGGVIGGRLSFAMKGLNVKLYDINDDCLQTIRRQS